MNYWRQVLIFTLFAITLLDAVKSKDEDADLEAGLPAMTNRGEYETAWKKHQAEREKYAYIGLYLRKKDKYVKPFSFGGVLTESPGYAQWLESADPMMHALAQIIHRIMADEFPDELASARRELKVPNGGCNFQLVPDERTFHHAFLFEHSTTYMREKIEERMRGHDAMRAAKGEEEAEEEENRAKEGGYVAIDMPSDDVDGGRGAGGGDDDEEEEEENKIKLAEYVLWETMQRGAVAYGKSARMDWSGLPPYNPAKAREDEKKWAKAEAFILKRVVNLVKGTTVYEDAAAEQRDALKWHKTAEELKEKEKMAKGKQTSSSSTGPNESVPNDHVIEIKNEERGPLKEKIDEMFTKEQILAMVEKLEKRISELLSPEKHRPKVEKIDHSPHRRLTKEKVHPYEFLQLVGYEIRVEPVGELRYSQISIDRCKEIRDKVIRKALYDSKSGFAKDMRARLGAQILFSVFNGKKWQKDLGFGMALSMLWTIGAGGLLDLLAWEKLTKMLMKWDPVTKKWKATFKSDALDVVLKSLSAFFVETGDSSIIGRMTALMRGGKLIPSLAQFLSDLKEASLSGVVSMFGSIANNIVVKLKSVKFVGLQFLTTLKSTATSAAMVPIQFDGIRRRLVKAHLLKIKEGFLPKFTAEQLEEQVKKNKPFLVKQWDRLRKNEIITFDMLPRHLQNEVIVSLIKEKMKLSVEIEKTTGMMVRSMGVGAIISTFLGFIPTYILDKKKLISEGIVNVWDLVVFQPTESYSLNYNYFAANYIGGERIQRFLSTDVNKYKQTAKLILEKSLEQYKGGKQNRVIVPISDEEIRKIYHTVFGQIPFYLGKFITFLINWVVNKFGRMWKKLADQVDNVERAGFIEGYKLVEVYEAEAKLLKQKYQNFLHNALSVMPEYEGNACVLFEKITEAENANLFTILSTDKGDGNEEVIAPAKMFFDEIQDSMPEVAENEDPAEYACLQNVFLFRATIALYEQLIKRLDGVEKPFEDPLAKRAREGVVFEWTKSLGSHGGPHLVAYENFLRNEIKDKIKVAIIDGTAQMEVGAELGKDLTKAYEYDYVPKPKTPIYKKIMGLFMRIGWSKNGAAANKHEQGGVGNGDFQLTAVGESKLPHRGSPSGGSNSPTQEVGPRKSDDGIVEVV